MVLTRGQLRSMTSLEESQGANKPERASLPLEILHFIFQHSDTQTLKCLRLAGKDLSFAAGEHLFRELWLVPNRGCLRLFKTIFKRSTMRQCFRILLYDASCEYHMNMCRREVTELGASNPIPTYLAGLDIPLLQSVLADGPTKTRRIVPELEDLLELCPRLEQLIVKPETSLALERTKIHPYYNRIFRNFNPGHPSISLIASAAMAQFPYGRLLSEHVLNVLSAIPYRTVASHTLTNFTLRDGIWLNIPPRPDDYAILPRVFQYVRHIDLSLTKNPRMVRIRHEHRRPIRQLLKMCPNVEELKLSATESLLDACCYSIDLKTLSLLRPLVNRKYGDHVRWPRLRRVILDGISSKQRDLVLFLSTHRSTLAHLKLRNIYLLPDRSVGSYPCWVATIEQLRSQLKLKTIDFGKYFTNGSDVQSWWASENSAHEHRLRPMVSKYVLGTEAQNPLWAARMPTDLSPTSVRGSEFEGDWTWARLEPDRDASQRWARQELSGDFFFAIGSQFDDPELDENFTTSMCKKIKWEHNTNEFTIVASAVTDPEESSDVISD